MRTGLLGPVACLCLVVSAHGAVISQWNFNSSPPDGTTTTGATSPSVGNGTAALVGSATATFSSGSSSDPAASDNSCWNTTHYPAAATNNLSAGVQFAVNTTGFEHIMVSWCQQNSSTASRYLRFQYTLDGSTYLNADVITVYAESVYTNKMVDLSAIPGAASNPDFAFRLLAEFQSTATGGAANYVATKDGSTYGTSGTIHYDLMTVSGTPIDDGNTAPYIFASIPDQTLRSGQASSALAFTVLDAEDPARNLSLDKASSNPGVVPPANIVFGGSGANRTVTVTGGGEAGSAVVTLYVIDTGGKSNSASFAVTVLPQNTAPFISTPPATNTLVNLPTPAIGFTVWDLESPASSLAVSASSANPALVPNGNLVFGGSGSNRNVTITPVPGQVGVAPITLTVSDGVLSSSSVFAVMVVPSASVLFYEPFAYGDGSVLTNSGFLWNNRSGAYGQCQTTNGQLQISAAQTEDIVAPLIGGPYPKGNGTVLYASFKANFLALPKIVPGYFAHFANGSTLRGRIYAGTTNAASGRFRLAVANGSDAWTQMPYDVSTNTTYELVTRYDLDTATTTLWLNPASESDASVTASDVQLGATVVSYAFRQDADLGGTVLVDDLKVGLSFAAVTSPSVTRIPLSCQRSGGSVILRWSDAAFSLQAAPVPAGVYTNVPGASSPFTCQLSTGARYFRLKHN